MLGPGEPAAGPWRIEPVEGLVCLVMAAAACLGPQRAHQGTIEVSADGPMVIVEGVGAARRELMPCMDAVVWLQSDMTEADRRGIARDGGTQDARDFWYQGAAEEIPFLVDQRPWQRADVVMAGTPTLRHDPGQVVLAPRPG